LEQKFARLISSAKSLNSIEVLARKILIINVGFRNSTKSFWCTK